MAARVSWETLRRLAGFRAERGRAISLYVGLDPRDTPTAGDVDARISSLLSEAEKSDGAARHELTHEQRRGLKADFDRIRSWFENDFDRDGVRGLGVFTSGLDRTWTSLELAEPVADGVRVGAQFYLAPLVPLLAAPGEGALVAAVGREKGEVYRLTAGRLVPLADYTEEQPGQHDQGGWSQARYGRHIETLVDWHLKDVAAEVDRHVRRLHAPPVVIVATDEARARFTDLLSQESRASLAGWAAAEAHASPAELLAAVTPVFDEWQRRKERQVLERWREEAGRSARAAAGWPETLTAASDGRVELLLYQSDARHEAWRCPACGRASVEGGPCPLDGTPMEKAPDGIDAAVHQTLAHGGTPFAVRHARDLDAVGGIGALLRY
jgi:peptide chain release factor subunit 1